MNSSSFKFFFSLLSVNIFILLVSTLWAQEPERIPLWSGAAPVGDGKTEEVNGYITIYRPQKSNGTAIIICPGGGYGGLVKGPEGSGIAKWLNSHGIVGVVLEYRLPNGAPYRPLYDAQRAIRTVRAKAAEIKCDQNKIGIIGFSAGGHLASTSATKFDSGDKNAKDPIEKVSCRPDFAILIYPVITMGEGTHNGSKNNLLGKQPTEEMIKLFSSELQITAKTPPTFLAHAKDDKVVIPANSQKFYDALLTHKVPGKYLELPSGNHGLNGYKGPMWDAWQTQSLEWLKSLDLISAK